MLYAFSGLPETHKVIVPWLRQTLELFHRGRIWKMECEIES